jgi:hypothetical protein
VKFIYIPWYYVANWFTSGFGAISEYPCNKEVERENAIYVFPSVLFLMKINWHFFITTIRTFMSKKQKSRLGVVSKAE